MKVDVAGDQSSSDMTLREQFDMLYAAARPVVQRYLSRRCVERNKVEDLCQETFIVAVRALRAGREVDVAWVIGVARNKLREDRRRHAREARLLRRVAAASGSGRAAGADAGVEAAVDLRGVPARQREALVLRHIGDQSVSVVARQLGLSIHATESLLARGRRALRTREGN